MTSPVPGLDEVVTPDEVPRMLSSATLSKLGHELRGPLSNIVSLTGLMARKVDQGVATPTDQIRQLDMLRGSAKEMLVTVERVIGLARLEDSDAEPTVENTDCRAVIVEVVDELANAAAAHDRRVHLDLPGEPLLASAPASVVRTIVAEFLDNAIKYSDQADIDLKASYREHTRQPTITVRDHGPGLNEGEQQRIFQPFQRGYAAADRDEPGTGLGLCLAQRAAARFGATLSTSTSPAGTAFAVTFAGSQT